MAGRDTVAALVDCGLITRDDVQTVLAHPLSHRYTVERLLVEQGVVSEADMIRVVSELFALPKTSLDGDEIDPASALLLPREVLENLDVFPMRVEKGDLLLAMVDPLDVNAADLVQRRTGLNVRRCIVSRDALARALHTHFGQQQLIDDVLAKMPDDGDVELLAHLREETNVEIDRGDAPPVVKLVNAILVDAVKMRASDIHVQPSSDGVRVRYRIDGLLRDIAVLPSVLKRSVVSRLKVISNLDIAETRRPQDGRAHFRIADHSIDLRVSTLPGLDGEKVVLRILDRRTGVLQLSGCGMGSRDESTFARFLRSPQGLVLITGPTGSGKTSTLYAALNTINNDTDSIVTVEDPIEYQLDGIHQVQVNERAGLNFASALRAILRQDPNVILVGEIRDLETAQIAVQAAMTGHFVLSTLHTNNAPATLNRLVYLGVERFPLASVLLGIVAQRLVRRLCPSCKEPCPPPAEQVHDVQALMPQFEPSASFHGRGCEECGFTGYRGRLGLFEILPMTNMVRDVLCRGGSEPDLARQARRDGMRSLLEDGLEKCAVGDTTLEEVLRVVPAEAMEPVESADPPTDPAFGRRIAPQESDLRDKILVVDDEPGVRRMLRAALESACYTVLEAESGQEALKVAWTERPDLIISDFRMDGMDGFELTRRLRQRLFTSLVPVILLTSAEGAESELAGLAAGADDYITKPVKIPRLLARVSTLLRRTQGKG